MKWKALTPLHRALLLYTALVITVGVTAFILGLAGSPQASSAFMRGIHAFNATVTPLVKLGLLVFGGWAAWQYWQGQVTGGDQE